MANEFLLSDWGRDGWILREMLGGRGDDDMGRGYVGMLATGD